MRACVLGNCLEPESRKKGRWGGRGGAVKLRTSVADSGASLEEQNKTQVPSSLCVERTEWIEPCEAGDAKLETQRLSLFPKGCSLSLRNAASVLS